jgi:hypothetical protein
MAQPIWNTPSGSIGTFPYGISMTYALAASPVSPSISITYTILAGTLPTNLTLDSTTGIISGIPTLVTEPITTTFAVRATDNLGNIRDATFNITITGIAVPQFTTPAGSLLSTQDSIWTQIQIAYSNPDSTNPVIVELQQGVLPPGLEISPTGMIQGYPEPPVINLTLPLITTVALSSESSTDYIYCLSVVGFTVGRPVIFANTFGDLVAGETYYVKSIDTSLNAFSISSSQNGGTLPLTDATGTMSVSLPPVSVGQPTITTYNFTLRLLSPLGGNIIGYSITVINQNTPVNQGGPGNPPNTRVPTILNTRPLTITVDSNDPYYGYYILPPVPTTQSAFMGTYESNNYFAFKVIGYDFDGNTLQYIYSNLPAGLTGDPNTGWITGTMVLATPGINKYSFSVSVRKTGNNNISSVNFNFSFNLSLDIVGKIVWVTPDNLGEVYNGTISTLSVLAVSDTPLEYRITSGTLPPNLSLLSNGELTGFIADQPTNQLLSYGDTTDFTFTVQAYSPTFSVVQSSKTFTVTVLQEFSQPTDTLYIKATPSLNDRSIINSLLTSTTLIPTDSLYRADDIYFGKATDVVYEHAYGIYASDIQQYLAAVTQNHYWRNITLGELKTAVAKNSNGDIIYEVVYSEVIDNLVNPQGQSVPMSIYWPTPIDLGLGPWYTSVTNVFTSYIELLNQKYYTSLTPGYARTLYPNSLYNMRTRVGEVVGQVYNSSLLPLWMTSQQSNGSTLGYTQAWVICYTKPGLADAIKTNIEANWPYTLNQINFEIDRFSVNKSATYDYDNNLNPAAWTGLPSASPTPDPLDSKDFYVLFPRQTILPDETQY